jgi:hypothetical protein
MARLCWFMQTAALHMCVAAGGQAWFVGAVCASFKGLCGKLRLTGWKRRVECVYVPSGSVCAPPGSARTASRAWLCLFNKGACTGLVLQLLPGWLDQRTRAFQLWQPACEVGVGVKGAFQVLSCGSPYRRWERMRSVLCFV